MFIHFEIKFKIQINTNDSNKEVINEFENVSFEEFKAAENINCYKALLMYMAPRKIIIINK